MTKIALLSINSGVGGIGRYTNEVRNLIMKMDGKLKFEDIELSNISQLGPGITFPLKFFLKDLSGSDIIHNLSSYPIYLNRNNNILCSTIHEFQAVSHPEVNNFQDKTIKDLVWRFFVAEPSYKSALNSDYIIASSKQTVKEALDLGYSKSRLFLVNLGVDRGFLTPTINKRNDQKFRVLYLGALSPRKNVKFAINAFKKTDLSNGILELWGKNIYKKEDLAKFVGGDKRIYLKGIASEKDLCSIYDSADVFCYPSLYEGFGIPIFEAMARGLPVIIYKNALISDEVRRYCFEAEDESDMANIIEDIKNNGYNNGLKKKATEYARSFTWEKTAKKTLEVYKNISKIEGL